MSNGGVAAVETGQSLRAARKPKPRGKQRRFLIALIIIVAALGFLIYSAMSSNSEYYLTVSEVQGLDLQARQSQVKLGGQVMDGTISWDRANNAVRFSVTDGENAMLVTYKGVVPDSFEPGADVILEGKVQQDGSFIATTMLAKCASKYEPQLPGASQ